jgi:hypothetical protein
MGQKPAICFFLRTAGQVSIYPTPTHLFFLWRRQNLPNNSLVLTKVGWLDIIIIIIIIIIILY